MRTGSSRRLLWVAWQHAEQRTSGFCLPLRRDATGVLEGDNHASLDSTREAQLTPDARPSHAARALASRHWGGARHAQGPRAARAGEAEHASTARACRGWATKPKKRRHRRTRHLLHLRRHQPTLPQSRRRLRHPEGAHLPRRLRAVPRAHRSPRRHHRLRAPDVARRGRPTPANATSASGPTRRGNRRLRAFDHKHLSC